MSPEPTLPLLPPAPDDVVVAYRDGRAIRRAVFLRHVKEVCERLPDAPQAMNMCVDRYWFAVTFLACITRGMVSIFPSSAAPEHLAALSSESPGLISIGDEVRTLTPQLPYLRVGLDADFEAACPPFLVPQVPASQCVARVYTSGTTGKPQGFDKYFGCLWDGMQAAQKRIWSVTRGACAVVGTTSFRHMFGFEATVLLPLWGGGQLSADVPFFPVDVAAALAALPEPRLLVITPFHLRKLLEADVALAPLAGILSATAPLSTELAARAEAAFQAPVLEIYGATELGMTASRQVCRQSDWEAMDGMQLHTEWQREEGAHADAQPMPVTWASGPSLRAPQALNDAVELTGPRSFRLVDRHANLINIVGKRSSLSFLNQLLCGIEGVEDGVFCLPEGVAQQDNARLMAFVVAPGLRAADVLTVLRSHVDPVFLPRPLVFIEHLPRDANGKVTAATLRQLTARHLS
jgi:acyl-coenzyme A synthetase/AMP-(fatty) acid ligase